ncbi:MAG: sugar ABC transporter permease [Chloroflexi bacterium]|nr:sugar ABC transporter permease [Chloroflexota bacterium]
MIAPIKRRLGLSTPLTLSQREALQGFIYISPWIIGFLVFTVGPMIASAYLSLTDYNIVTPPRFAGLNNYEFMFKDRLFWKSIENTLYYTIIFVPIAIAGSLGLAMLLNQKIAGRVALRTLYFLPSITPVVAAAFLWLWIFQPQIGLMNAIISALGLGDGPLWLGHPGSSKPALIIISLWGALGGNTMLIFLAALQGIPKELYESADIDGAGGVGKFRFITVPSISPVILFNTVLGVIGALQMFTLAYVASSGQQQMFSPGGPLNSTLFYVLHLYNSAFDFWEMGYASALAWVFFVIVLAITAFQLWTSRRWVYYEGED